MANKIIGITGGIGAGKSIVSRILRGRGYKVYDCDYEAKRLMNESCHLKEGLVSICGEGTYEEDGALDRKYLAAVIFSNHEKRAEVNRLVHASVREDFLEQAEKTPGVIFVEAAIMGSSGLAPLCAEVWNVTAPEDIRFARAMARGGISSDDLRSRIAAQEKETELLRQSGVRIEEVDNSPSSNLLYRIDELLGRER